MSLRVRLAQRLQGRLFYGWVMLVVAMAGQFASSPGQTYVVSVFLPSLLEEFDLSRTAISSAYGFGTMLGAFGLTAVGLALDRYGPRMMMVLASAALGIVCFCFPLAGGLGALYILFTFQRFWGQGSLTLACNTLVAQWFERRRGTALSLQSLGGAVGQALFPPVTLLMIAAWGWRPTWIALGAAVWVLVLPAAALLVVDKPEVVGQSPDGRPPRPSAPEGASATEMAQQAQDSGDFTRKEALRTWQFWALSFARATSGALSTGLVFHQISILAGQGVGAAVAATVFAVSSGVRVAGTLAVGPLLDRFPARYIYSLGYAVFLAAMLQLTTVAGSGGALVYGALVGLAGALMYVPGTYCYPRYYGRAHIGSIQGFANTLAILGAALGPLPFGMAFDLLGNYRAAILWQALLPAVLTVVLVFTGPPRRPRTY